MAVKKTVKKAETKAEPKVEKETAAKKAPAKKAPAKKAASKPAAEAPAKVASKVAKKVAGPAAPKKTGQLKAPVEKPVAPKTKYKMPKYKIDEDTGRPILPKGYAPSVDEEYMNPLQLEYFRQKLVGRREELIEESKQTIENLKDEVRDIGDEAERASRETENALELRTRDRYRKLINKIDSVIRRVDEGDYGYCVDTGEEIGLERLEARPEAERTIDAQERWEIRRKQLGD